MPAAASSGFEVHCLSMPHWILTTITTEVDSSEVRVALIHRLGGWVRLPPNSAIAPYCVGGHSRVIFAPSGSLQMSFVGLLRQRSAGRSSPQARVA